LKFWALVQKEAVLKQTALALALAILAEEVVVGG